MYAIAELPFRRWVIGIFLNSFFLDQLELGLEEKVDDIAGQSYAAFEERVLKCFVRSKRLYPSLDDETQIIMSTYRLRIVLLYRIKKVLTTRKMCLNLSKY